MGRTCSSGFPTGEPGISPMPKPQLSPVFVGIPTKVKDGLCTWEQTTDGFDEPVGSCLEKATHGLTYFEGRKDFTYCEYHANACATPGGQGPYKPYRLEA